MKISVTRFEYLKPRGGFIQLNELGELFHRACLSDD